MIKSTSIYKQAKNKLKSLFTNETSGSKNVNINHTKPDIPNPFFKHESEDLVQTSRSDITMSTLSNTPRNVKYHPSFDEYDSDSIHSCNNEYEGPEVSHEDLKNAGLIMNNYLEEYDQGPSLSTRNSSDEFLLRTVAVEKIDNLAYDEAYLDVRKIIEMKSSTKDSDIDDFSVSSLSAYTTKESAQESTQSMHLHLFSKVANLIIATKELNETLKVQAQGFPEQSEGKVKSLKYSVTQKDIIHDEGEQDISDSQSLGGIELSALNLRENESLKIHSPISNQAMLNNLTQDCLPIKQQDTTSAAKMLYDAHILAKNVLQATEADDKSTIKNLIVQISELTSQLQALKSDVINATNALESKFIGIEEAIAPTIQINEANMKHYYDTHSVHQEPALNDFHNGFIKTMEKYCIGAATRSSGLVNTASDLGPLSLVGIVPGAGLIAAPIEFLVASALEIQETNAISNAINNMPSVNIMINQIIPALALKITLHPQNIVNIRKATFTQFESLIKTAENIVWVDGTPNPQLALGATQALSIMQALECNKIDFNTKSIDESISQTLIYLFGKTTSAYELEEVNNNLIIKPEIPYEIFVSNSQKSSICKNQSQENNSFLGSCTASKLQDSHVVLGDKIQTPTSCCSCLGEFGISKWAREHISFMWHSNNDHQDLI
ncbi:MAG: hypothetical protein EB127_20730 [Alphaproteobacteria bacterium]|nr:hypothetical protein [Alphaproteobacteria bacterium]